MSDLADLAQRTVAGAAAGNLTVPGIQLGDILLNVHTTDAAGANLAAEFTVTADDTINNTGGTSTAAHIVLVQWQKKYKGRNQFESATGDRQGRLKY